MNVKPWWKEIDKIGIHYYESRIKKLEKRNTQLCLDLSMADECLQEKKEQIRKLEAENKELRRVYKEPWDKMVKAIKKKLKKRLD